MNTLDEKAWQDFLSEFNQRVMSETTFEDFKEELWNTVVKLGEPVLMFTGIDDGSFSILDEDEIVFNDIAELCKHATGLAVCVCDVDLDSGR